MAVSAILGAISTAVTTVGGGVLLGGTLVTHFLVTTAMGAALNALSPKVNAGNAGSATEGVRGYSLQGESGASTEHQIIYGEARVGGVRIYDTATGNDNIFLHRIIAFAGHEIDSYQQIYLNDELVTLDASGNVTSPTRYSGFVRIKKHLGAIDQTADEDLIAETTAFLGSRNGEWTPEHRLQGIAYLYVRFMYGENAFPNGVPSVSAVIRGKKVYNPSTNVTAWSDNPALCIRDYLTSDYGLKQQDARIDDTLVEICADVCDEIGYTCNGAFLTGVEPSSVLGQLLTSMGGLLWYGQGKWRIKAASWSEPSLSFNEDDLRSGISLSTRHSRRDNFNVVKGTFRGPETGWQPADYPQVDNAFFLEQDKGVSSVLDFPLPFTTSSRTARRIARIALNRNREQLTFKASFGMRAFQVQVGDFVKITNSRFGWLDKPFEVVEWTFGLSDNLDIQIQMTLREISQNVFEEGDEVSFEDNNTTLPNPFVILPPAISVGGELRVINEQPIGFMTIDLSQPNNIFKAHFEVEYKRSTDTSYTPLGTSSLTRFEVPAVEDGFYDVRARSVNTLGIKSEYSVVENWYLTLFGAPPATVQNFTGNVVGGSLYLTWSAVPDLDLSHYKIRYSSETTGAEYQNAVDLALKVARPAVSLVVPARSGTYFIRAVDKSGNTSPDVSSFVVNVNVNLLENLNVVETLIEHPNFLGNKSNVVATEGLLMLDTSTMFDSLTVYFDDEGGLFDSGGIDGSFVSSGMYEFEQIVDLGAVYLSRVKVNLETLFLDYVDTFDSASGDFDSRLGDFDGDPAKFDLTSVRAQVSYTNDNPNISPNWSPWQDIVVSDIPARALRFRVVLETSSSKTSPAVTSLTAEVDMVDRVESGSDITYTGSTTVTFPVPFKNIPAVGISAVLADGDRYVISSKSKNGFTITTYTGASVSTNPTTIDYVAKGYGKEIT